MKQVFLTAVICTISLGFLNAQNTRVGFTAGGSLANFRVESDEENESGDMKLGITAGVLVDIPAGKNFSFQPALNFVQKGTKDEETFMGITEKFKMNINSLEVPLNMVFNVNSNSGTFFFGAGPSFTFNLSGKAHYDDGTDSFSESIEIGNDPDKDDIKGLEFGANILAGYRFPNGLFISTGFNAGLNNLIPGGNDDAKFKSHYFSIKLGWLLNGSNGN